MLEKAKNIFFIGIKGAAMANLAVVLKKMGKNVTGVDLEEEFITDSVLMNNRIAVINDFNAEALPENTDLIIYSAAHGGINNPQVAQAKKTGIKIAHQAEILGELSSMFQNTIAICGCHGKTTTASLLSYALIKLGNKPTYLIGVPSFNEYPGGDYQDKKYFVLEADEYGVSPPVDKTPKFLFLKPNHIIATNIDFDHPDVYADIEQTKKAFLKFFDAKKLVLCADDPILAQLIKRLNRNQYVSYGYSLSSDLQIKNPKFSQSTSSFELYYHQKSLGKFTVALFGKKNISNAAAVILMLLNLGFSAWQIRQSIATFTGAKRRFEQIFYGNGIYLFDDYGHHPHEIRAVIEAVRSRFPQQRLILIFQPHTFSRTQALLKDFSQILSSADYSFIMPIFPSAREDQSLFKITSQDIADYQKKQHNLIAVANKNELIQRLSATLKRGDIVFTLGAGDVYKLKNDIIGVIKKSNDQTHNWD